MPEAKLFSLKWMLPTWMILSAPWLSVNHFTQEPERDKPNEFNANWMDISSRQLNTLSSF